MYLNVMIWAQDCMDNGEAGRLHAQNGEFQLSQDPRIAWVPWLNFNGVSDPAVSDEIDAMGLVAYICANYDIPSCAWMWWHIIKSIKQSDICVWFI